MLEQPEDGEQQRGAQGRGEHEPLQHVGHEECRRHAIEPVALLDHEGAPEVEGERGHCAHDQNAEHGGEVAGVALAEEARAEGIDRRDASPQGERQQQRPVDDGELDQVQALLVERVVGRPAMRLDRDQAREVRRHLAAMARDVERLAHAEPQAPRECGDHEGGEDGGEGGSAHWVWWMAGPRDTIASEFTLAYGKWHTTRPLSSG